MLGVSLWRFGALAHGEDEELREVCLSPKIDTEGLRGYTVVGLRVQDLGGTLFSK